MNKKFIEARQRKKKRNKLKLKVACFHSRGNKNDEYIIYKASYDTFENNSSPILLTEWNNILTKTYFLQLLKVCSHPKKLSF